MKKIMKGFTLIELVVVIIILGILGTTAYISLDGSSSTQEAQLQIKEDCKKLGYDVFFNGFGNIGGCSHKKLGSEVMDCIKEYTNGLDEKYNNPDTVINLREDNYSQVVKTCNEIFGENN